MASLSRGSQGESTWGKRHGEGSVLIRPADRSLWAKGIQDFLMGVSVVVVCAHTDQRDLWCGVLNDVGAPIFCAVV